jgi:signal transduction histidine kinase
MVEPRESLDRAAPLARATLAELVLDAEAEGVAVCASDGRILFASRALQRTLGRTEAELVGTSIDRCFSPPLDFAEIVERLALGENGCTCSRLVETPAAAEVATEVTLELRRLDPPPPSEELWTVRLADRGEGCSFLGEWNDSLARIVAGFAHEVRNPLAAIHGLVDLWSDAAGDSPDREIVDRIRGQVTRLDRLVRDLVAFELPPSPSPAEHELAEVLAATRAALEGAGLAPPPGFGSSSLGAEVRVWTDPGYCARILEELVRNAHDAAPPTIPPTFSMERRPAAGSGSSEVALVVSDLGPGVAERHRNRIFEPFFTTKRHRTGIGLTMARVLARRIAARIELRSSSGRPTEFALVLPERRP